MGKKVNRKTNKRKYNSKRLRKSNSKRLRKSKRKTIKRKKKKGVRGKTSPKRRKTKRGGSKKMTIIEGHHPFGDI